MLARSAWTFVFGATQLQLQVRPLFFWAGVHARKNLVPFVGASDVHLLHAIGKSFRRHRAIKILHPHSPSKKLRSCAVSPPVPLTGRGRVAFSVGNFSLPLSTSNASGVDSGEYCRDGGFDGGVSL
jgi:hypothetical protein